MPQPWSWRRLLLCAVLEFAALTGAPLRPKDIELALKPAETIASGELSESGKPDRPTSGE